MGRRPNVNHTQLRDGLVRDTISKGRFVQGMHAISKKFVGGHIVRGRIDIAPSWRPPPPPPACAPKEKGNGDKQ
jgi:hypothetical protein